jgi:hypothetical protein
MTRIIAENDTYWVATNRLDVWHYGFVNKGEEIATGQPELLLFETEAEMLAIIPDEFKQMW